MGLNRLYGGVALCAMVAGTAAAQEQRPTLLGEILVLGEKSERNLQETRTGVQVFTQEIIEDSSIEDIDDVLDQTANATQRFGGEGFAIRGIQNANVAGGGQSPLATFYVDGAPFNSFALRTGIEEVWDVAQVEIFKGPQSTLFGRNALAGVINLKTNDPEYANYARFRAQGGTQETYGGSFVINGNIIDGELALRIAGDWNSSDGFYDNPTLRNDRQAFNRNQSLRGKLLFEPFDNVSNVLTLTYSNNESGDDEADKLTGVFNQTHFGNIAGGEDTETFIAALDTTIDITENWYLKNILTFNSTNYDRLDDEDPSFQGVLDGTNALGNPLSFSRDNITSITTEEMRLHYEDETFRAHFGGYFAREVNDDSSGGLGGVPDSVVQDFLTNSLPNPALVPLLLPAYTANIQTDRDATRDSTTTNYAAFGEAEYDVSDFVTVFGGFRVDVETFDFNSTELRNTTGLPQTATSVECQTAQALAGGLDVCTLLNAGVAAQDVAQSVAATNRTTSVAFLPAVGVTLNWTDDLATSFTVKRGYRAGGAGRTFLSAQDFEFDPEFAWNYELGLRSTWLDDRLTVNANVFYFDWNNQQVSIDGPLGALDSLVVNAGSSRTFGGELEFFAAATDNLDLRGSVGYVNTRFTDFVNQGQVLTGNEFPNAPNWTAAVAAIYEFDSGFYIQADANYRSNAFTSADNNPGSFEDSRTLVNGKIGYRNDYLDAQIFATNLFDVDYIEHTSAATNTAKVGDGLFVGARVTVDLDFDG